MRIRIPCGKLEEPAGWIETSRETERKMDPHQLKTFCRIVELHSFSRAARDLGLSQPAASAHVRALEGEVGIRLLDRLGREVKPSRAGEMLYQYARGILRLSAEAEASLKAFAQGKQGKLSLGGSRTPSEYVLPEKIAAFLKKFPSVSISLQILNSYQIAERVLEGTIELGIVGAQVPLRALHYEPFLDDELVVVLPADHPWGRKGTISVQEFSSLSLIVREAGSGTRSTLEEILRRNGLPFPNVVVEIASHEGIKKLVQMGVGAAVLSRIAVAHELGESRVAAVKIRKLPLKRSFSMVTLKGRNLSPVALRFQEQLRGSLRDAQARKKRRGR